MAEKLQSLSDCKTHLPPVCWAITQDRCQQLHPHIPLNVTAPTTISPPLHSHKSYLCLFPDHNTSSCISPHLLLLLLSCFCPLSVSQCFHKRYHHYGLLPLTQGQSPSHVPAWPTTGNCWNYNTQGCHVLTIRLLFFLWNQKIIEIRSRKDPSLFYMRLQSITQSLMI